MRNITAIVLVQVQEEIAEQSVLLSWLVQDMAGTRDQGNSGCMWYAGWVQIGAGKVSAIFLVKHLK